MCRCECGNGGEAAYIVPPTIYLPARAPAFSRSVRSCVAAPEGVDTYVQFMTVMATKMPFVGRVIPMKVLVTGGTSGLGLAMASA